MWNDWLSSLTGPASEQLAPQPEVPEPIETPRRFTNPAQIERLQNLQSQHQQLQVQQLHLLHKQYKLQRDLALSGDSPMVDSSSNTGSGFGNSVSSVLAEVVRSATPSNTSKAGDFKKDDSLDLVPSSVKSETEETMASSEAGAGEEPLPAEVWQQFHAIQAQQWAQALNQARIAKRQTTGGALPGLTTPLGGGSGLGLLPSGSGSAAGGKRCKAYAAPKGVWKNNGGYNATIYVHKRRIYGPIRRDLSDAIEDRKEMEDALRELTAIHNSPEDAAILEVEMREVVAGLRNRSTPNRPEGPASAAVPLMPSARMVPAAEGARKRLRLVGGSNQPTDDEVLTAQSPDVLGPFAAPLQLKEEHGLDVFLTEMPDEEDDDDHHDLSLQFSRGAVGYTPNTGPIRDVYGSPGPLFGGAPGLLDERLDMLPDSLGGGMWG